MEALLKNKSLWQRLKTWATPFETKEPESRFEKKFIVPIHELNALETRLEHFACYPIHQARWIHNLYCDTLDYQHYNENIEGLADRKKLRFRWYGSEFGLHSITAEFKIKSDDTNYKRSLKLGKIAYSQNAKLSDLFDQCFKQWQLLAPSDAIIPLDYIPTLYNRYHRRYFMNADDSIRITIDHPVIYRNVQTEVEATQDRFAIVELKCPKHHILFHDLMPFQLHKSSKYVEGIQLTDPLFESSSI